ncbi:MAG: hypothetical protein F6K00_27095 [Leptolyngbya sp. SIOISBB]|nr:hypothetical protein [Leptolyngbya sp. SIOISBB]
MTQETYNRSVQIIEPITAANASQITVIYDSGYVSPFDMTQSLKFYGFITDLRARIDIRSLPESEIPDIPLGTSRTSKAEIVRELEYGSARYELELLIRNTYSGWMSLFNFSLLNRRPFYVVDLLSYLSNQPAFAMANDARLGVRVLDVGFGTMQAGDSVNIFGAAREEVTSLPSEGDLITQSAERTATVGTGSEVILAAAPVRKQAVIVNRSETATVTLSYQPMATPDDGIVLYPGGGAYEINRTNLYRGLISAISTEANTALSIAEFF